MHVGNSAFDQIKRVQLRSMPTTRGHLCSFSFSMRPLGKLHMTHHTR